jgi:hypothetical protein
VSAPAPHIDLSWMASPLLLRMSAPSLPSRRSAPPLPTIVL